MDATLLHITSHYIEVQPRLARSGVLYLHDAAVLPTVKAPTLAVATQCRTLQLSKAPSSGPVLRPLPDFARLVADCSQAPHARTTTVLLSVGG